MKIKILNLLKKISLSQRVSSSLRLQIALMYLSLAVLNIVFFSVMIFENQMDLIISNFKYQADSLVEVLIEEIDKVGKYSNDSLSQGNLKSLLKSNGVFQFLLLSNLGEINYKEDPENSIDLPENIKEKLVELSSKSLLVKTKYDLELDSERFIVRIIIPLKGLKGEQFFIYTNLSIKAILDRLNLLYFQIFLSVSWGIIFHILFAIYLFRLIFKRLEFLGRASETISTGDFSARIDWNFSKNDELDKLGITFNTMASNIESSIEKITKLNDEIQRELEIGKQVQTLFLPNSSRIKEFNPSIFYRPMREVSGDIYNFFDIDKRFKAVFIADATGHGVSAAIVTTVIQMTLNNLITKTKNPMKIMNQLCKVMLDVFDSNFMASGVFLLFDSNSKLYINNSAHNPPLLFKKNDNRVIEINNNGMLLGMMETSSKTIQKCSIRPGDKILLYTDGLTESKNNLNLMYGLERVKKIILENKCENNNEILNILIKDFTEYVLEYKDDVTAIIIEVPKFE